MSNLICKNCKSSIVARDISPPNSKHRNYVCPYCGASIHSFKIINIFIGLGVVYGLWVIQFFYYHISNGNIPWSQENIQSLLLAILSLSLFSYGTYKIIRLKKVNTGSVSKKWIIMSAFGMLLFINEIHTAASRVWGL